MLASLWKDKRPIYQKQKYKLVVFISSQGRIQERVPTRLWYTMILVRAILTHMDGMQRRARTTARLHDRWKDESDRNLALYSGAQVAQTRLIHERGGLANQSSGLYRLLQSDHGQAFQVDPTWGKALTV